MKTQSLFCREGKHEWTREAKRGKPPINCPEHKVTPTPPTKTTKDDTKTVVKRLHEGKARNARLNREQKIRDILAAPAPLRCTCGISPEITDAEFRDLCGHSCTSPSFVCPTLDRVMRSVYTYA